VTGYFSGAPRPLTPADAEPVRGLVIARIGVTPYVDRVLELLAEAERADSDTHALIIERDGTCVALALFGQIVPSNGVWKLHTMLLSERIHAREVGDAMLLGVMEKIRTLGARFLLAEMPGDPVYGQTLNVLRANRFRQQGKVPDFYRDGVSLLFLIRDL
jgi:hypothetical protein